MECRFLVIFEKNNIIHLIPVAPYSRVNRNSVEKTLDRLFNK